MPCLSEANNIWETRDTLFHGGSVQLENLADAAVLIALVAAGQIPDDRDLQISTKREDQSIALSHAVIRHAFGRSRTQGIIDMDIRSSLIQQDTASGFRLHREIIDESSNLLLKV